MSILMAEVSAQTIIKIPVSALPPAVGVVASYYHSCEQPDVGVKVFESRCLALARWRVESLAGVAGLGPPVLSPVRELNLVDGWGYIVRHAAPWEGSESSLKHVQSQLRILAEAAGLKVPTDLAERNLGVVDGRAVLIDWGNDDQADAVGGWRRKAAKKR